MKKSNIFATNYWMMISSLIIALILTGCEKPEIVTGNKFDDGGFFSKEPCGPPCFYGIEPGITTQDETIEIIQKAPEVFENCTFSDSQYSEDHYWANCDFFDLLFEKAIVQSLDFYPATVITTEQVVSLYGNPDSVSTYISSLFPDVPFKVTMQFCYNEIMTYVFFEEQNGSEYKIKPNTQVYLIYYENPNSYDPLCGSSIENNQWKGYGKYEGVLGY